MKSSRRGVIPELAVIAKEHPIYLRTARIGDLRLVASPIPPGSELVRVHVGDDPGYERMIVVTPEADGSLHLAGWIGAPLTPAEWR